MNFCSPLDVTLDVKFCHQSQINGNLRNFYENLAKNIAISFFTKKTQLPAILVPSFHLSIGQVEFSRKFHSILNTEVFLTLKARFQCLELVISESGSGFPLFFRMRMRIGTAASAITILYLDNKYDYVFSKYRLNTCQICGFVITKCFCADDKNFTIGPWVSYGLDRNWSIFDMNLRVIF